MKSYRDRLPAPAGERQDVSPWSVLKQSVGKELTRITMPVAFNEPLSFLQRIAENAEYYPLLVQANNSDDAVSRMEVCLSRLTSGTLERSESEQMCTEIDTISMVPAGDCFHYFHPVFELG